MNRDGRNGNINSKLGVCGYITTRTEKSETRVGFNAGMEQAVCFCLARLLQADIRFANCITSRRCVLSCCLDTVQAAILHTPAPIGQDVLPPVEAACLGDFEY